MKKVRRKLCYIVSSPMTVTAFLGEHINLCSQEYDVFVIANCDQSDFLNKLAINATLLNVSINRKIKPLQDVLALINLVTIFIKLDFDIIHSVTPKAGLLAQFAGWLTRVPVRIHIFTGQVWATKKNPFRFFLKSLDYLISQLSTNILVDSQSQRNFLLSEHVVSENKSHVLGKGSISGVNTRRFRPNLELRHRTREQLSIPSNAFVLLYLGRLNTEKGVLDLAEAYSRIANLYPKLWLLFVGPDEDSLLSRIREICPADTQKVIHVDFTNSPESYFNAADIFCLPSYREGFGSTIIEAAACGIPSVASRIYGVTDAIIDEQTGLLHTAADISELIRCIELLINNENLYKSMSDAAYKRSVIDFDQQNFSNSLFNYYQSILLTNIK